MPYELYEGLDNAGDLLKALSKAVTVESDGGQTITLSEIMGILTDVGFKIINDIQD